MTGIKIVTPLFTEIVILSVKQMNSKNDCFIIDHSGRNYFPQIDQNFAQTQTGVFDSMPTKLSNRYRYFFNSHATSSVATTRLSVLIKYIRYILYNIQRCGDRVYVGRFVTCLIGSSLLT